MFLSRLALARGRRLWRVPADTDPTPTVASVDDTTVPCGATVTVTGTGFQGVSPRAGQGFVQAVYVGVTAVTYSVASATSLTLTAPDVPGTHAVVVKTSGGCASLPGLLVRPRIDSVSPASVPDVGGVVVTLTGVGFTGATEVSVPMASATPDFTIVDDTTITFTAPAVLGGGTANVYVTTAGQQSDPAELVYSA